VAGGEGAGGGGLGAEDGGAGAEDGGAAGGAGFTLSGRSEVWQLPLLPCRDTRTVSTTRVPGLLLPTWKSTVHVPWALAWPAALSPLAGVSGPVAVTRARAMVLTRILTVV
jgi:hypothetical protein